MTTPLHPLVEPLRALLGQWRGVGHGVYPTVDAFDYVEQVSFGHAGKPVLVYSQRTEDAATGEPRHGESGFWKVADDGRLEVVIAHANGVTEITEGSVVAGHIALRSTVIGLTSTAKQVLGVNRTFDVDGDELRYSLDMAAVAQEMQRHLTATLHRVG